MKHIIIAITTVLLSLTSVAQTKQKIKIMETGKKAFDAWQIGERTGNYTDFKALLSKNFNSFSHPLIGRFANGEALNAMLKLIADRKITPNNLEFSNAIFSSNANSITIQFDSKGMVQNNAFAYAGYNIIVFEIENSNISGFKEYFGFVDPNWFK
jgi:hypothetical protein